MNKENSDTIWSIVFVVVGAVLASTGFEILVDWTAPVDLGSDAAIRVSKTARGKGAFLLLLLNYWPHILIGGGLIATLSGFLRLLLPPAAIPSKLKAASRIALVASFFLLSKSSSEYIKRPTLEKELEKGYREVSSSFDDLKERLTNKSLEQAMTGAAYAVARFLPDSELIVVYGMRSQMFARLESQPELHFLCLGETPQKGEAKAIRKVLSMDIVRYIGRAYAYQSLNQEEYHPAADLRNDTQVWKNAYETLSLLHAKDAIAVLFDGATDGPAACRGTAEIYDLASNYPKHSVGTLTLLDFTRAVDKLGAQYQSPVLFLEDKR